MKKILSIISIFFLLMIFVPSAFAGTLITSMDDIPYLQRNEKDVKALGIDNSVENDRIVISYKEAEENNIAALELDTDEITAGRSVDEITDLLEVSQEVDTDALIASISNNESVEAVDYEIYGRIVVAPNDSYYKEYQYNYALVNADKTWNDVGKNSVKVAIIDTGTSVSHPDLTNRVSRDGYDIIAGTTTTTDYDGHGTMVSGIIAAKTNNKTGVAGFTGTNNVTVVPYAALDSKGEGSSSDIVAVLNMINKRDDIKIVNMSLGFEKDVSTLRAAINRLYNNGKLIIAASGNSDENFIMYPAAYSQVIAVGSVDPDLKRSSQKSWGTGNGSNYGEGLDVVAPGTEIASTGYIPDEGRNTYLVASGTSFSSPTVSALAAILLSHNDSLTSEDVKSILNSTAKDLYTKGYDIYSGYGMIQFDKALAAAKSYEKEEPENPSTPSVDPTPTTKPNTNTNDSTNTAPYELAVSAHVENIGWLPSVPNNQMAGTKGNHLKLEALKIVDNNNKLNITAQVHVENIGDMAAVSEGGQIGTTGQNNGIEAIRIYANGSDSSKYNIYYRVHVENYGWTQWTKNGNWAGTKGKNLQLEAVQLMVTDNLSLTPAYRSDVDWVFR